jgi:hypothetical protein
MLNPRITCKLGLRGITNCYFYFRLAALVNCEDSCLQVRRSTWWLTRRTLSHTNRSRVCRRQRVNSLWLNLGFDRITFAYRPP